MKTMKKIILAVSIIGIFSTAAFAEDSTSNSISTQTETKIADCSQALNQSRVVIYFKGGNSIDPNQYDVLITMGNLINQNLPVVEVQLNSDGFVLEMIAGKGLAIGINKTNGTLWGALGAGKSNLACLTNLDLLEK